MLLLIASAVVTWVTLELLTASAPMRQFRLVTADGTSYSGTGTEIRSEGWCSELLVNGKVTAIMCQPHFVVEVFDVPAKPSGARTVAQN